MENKGEIRKLSFLPRTLDESIIKDGLVAASLLNDLEPYYLVGGIATQTYLPTSCRRPTSDIDFSLVRPLTHYEDFKTMVKPIMEYLLDTKHSVETKKRSRAYCLDVTNSSGDSLTLEFARRNDQNFNKNKVRLSRELENANNKILEERDCTYRVASTEDIAVPKLVRAIGSLKRNEYFNKYIPEKIEPMDDERVKKQLTKINEIREEAMINLADFELAEKLRFLSDLYDIRILSEIAGFNEKYIRQVENDWDVLREDSKEKDKLMKSLLPNF